MSVFTIANGTVVRHDETFAADLVIEDGVITEIHQRGAGGYRGYVVDAEGLLVLPGAIDIHFHCRAPAYPERGDFATETQAAASGGVTTVLEMPISNPTTATGAAFEERRSLGERFAFVNFGLYAAPGLLDPRHIEDMVEVGAIGFKTFTTASPPGRDDEFAGLSVPNERDLMQVVELIRPYNLPAVFHAENNQLLKYFEERLVSANHNGPMAHTESRPPIVEGAAVAFLTTVAQETGIRIHIAHLSTALGVDLVRDARARGLTITAEVCPHHLLFTADVLEEIGPYGKINPPLRSEVDRLALWSALADGTIDLIASDHSTFTVEEKERGWDDIWLAPPGTPSVEVLYPFVLDRANRGCFSLNEAVNLVSTRPARLVDLYPNKGVIQVGADADLVLYDPSTKLDVDRSRWFSKAAACDRLYTGTRLSGVIRQTFVGGKCIYRDGQIVGSAGDGRFVRPIGAKSVARS